MIDPWFVTLRHLHFATSDDIISKFFLVCLLFISRAKTLTTHEAVLRTVCPAAKIDMVF
jgi:hypothetical protein